MIKINVRSEVVTTHVNAVMACIRKRYDERTVLASVQQLGVNSIEEFLQAKPTMLKQWVAEYYTKLQFTCFKDIYIKYFSNSKKHYVAGNYNAYEFLRLLGVDVCPYCEDEYLDCVEINGRDKRTSEIDHFYSKSKYPALAMCIYNLIPSGQACNGLKSTNELGANPHEEDIEERTFLYPDIPMGVLMDSIAPEKCAVKFNAIKGMELNVANLALEQRYERHATEVHELLSKVQKYNDDKIDEMVRAGFGTREEIITLLFGSQDPEVKKHKLRQKMLKDLTGY